jgi:hypothetical protein
MEGSKLNITRMLSYVNRVVPNFLVRKPSFLCSLVSYIRPVVKLVGPFYALNFSSKCAVVMVVLMQHIPTHGV